jgi:hypothetical protein
MALDEAREMMGTGRVSYRRAPVINAIGYQKSHIWVRRACSLPLWAGAQDRAYVELMWSLSHLLLRHFSGSYKLAKSDRGRTWSESDLWFSRERSRIGPLPSERTTFRRPSRVFRS